MIAPNSQFVSHAAQHLEGATIGEHVFVVRWVVVFEGRLEAVTLNLGYDVEAGAVEERRADVLELHGAVVDEALGSIG